MFYVEENVGDGSTWTEHSYSSSVSNQRLFYGDINDDCSLDVINYETAINWSRINCFLSSGELTSAILDIGTDATEWGSIAWEADLPAGTALAFQVRSGTDPGNLGSWSAEITTSGTDLSSHITDGDRYFQYKLVLGTTDTDYSAILRSVTINYATGGGSDDDPPEFTDASATDTSQGGEGIQDGDQVVLTFNEGTNGPTITNATIDSVLALSGGHSWLSGSGVILGVEWNTTTETNDTLTVTLSVYGGTPTIAVGDNLTADGVTIIDGFGNACVDTIPLGGDFGSDTVPPAITHEAIETAPIGADLTVSAEITDTSGIDLARVFYRQVGTGSFYYLDMSGSSDDFSGNIPGVFITERGLEYYLWASDGINTVTYPTDGATAPLCTQVSYMGEGISSGANQHHGSTVADYRLFSVPTDYGAEGGTPTAVLEDDLGAYDKEKWRLARYQSGQFVEYTAGNIENFKPGRSYWLIIAEAGKQLDSGAGVSPDSSSAYTIPLTAGWNQIANPFAFSVGWQDVLDLDANTAIVDDLGNPVDYDGSYGYDVVELAPWSGYWLYYEDDGTTTLYIPASEYVPDGGGDNRAPLPLKALTVAPVSLTMGLALLPAVEVASGGGFGDINTSRSADSAIAVNSSSRQPAGISSLTAGLANIETPAPAGSEAEWQLNLRLDSGGLVDDWNRVGVFAEATDYWDKLEQREPPYLSGAPNLCFEHQDWPNRRGVYATDVRPDIGEGAEFNLLVSPAVNSNSALLTWSGLDELPSRLEAILHDPATGVRIALHNHTEYEIAFAANETARQLTILIGNEEWIDGQLPDSPRRAWLAQSYPNPARSLVTIEFGLSETGPVELAVYDLAGRRVATLVNEELAAGERTISWNAEVASGVYLYQLTTESDALTRRLVISR